MAENHPAPKVLFKYLIRNERDERYGLVVNTVGYQTAEPHRAYPADSHPSGYYFSPENGRILREYQLLYIAHGRGFFTADARQPEQEISSGTVILLSPGQWHSYRPAQSTGWSEYFIGFEGAVADNALAELCASGERIFAIGLDSELTHLYDRAVEIAVEDKPGTQQYLAGIVMHMTGLLLSKIRSDTVTMGNLGQMVERAKIRMNEQVDNDLDLQMLADELHISYSWFRKIFRDYTGHAPAHYFQLLKLRRAQHLLTNTQLAIKEVAFSLGYKSAEHFFSVFKRLTGYTPAAYRNHGHSGEQA